MQINPILKFQILPQSQNFKGNSETVESVPLEAPPQVPLDAAKAYASPQINPGYREIKTFDVNNVGSGKFYELSNGHKVIIIPKSGPTTINTAVGVGYFNEPANLKQMSHLLEHLVDNNCSNPKDKDVESVLAKTGAFFNAGTSHNYTNYYMEAPISDTKDLENLIMVHSKTLANTDFTDEDIETEKKIVTQELNSKYYFTRNNSHVLKYSLENLFNIKDGDDVAGLPSYETIANIKKDDLINYYNNFYRLDNMVTTIVGEVDDNTIKTVAKYMGQVKPSKKVNSDIKYPEIKSDNLIQKPARKDFVSLDKNTSDADILVSFVGPENGSLNDNLNLYLLKQIIRNRLKKADDLFFTISSDAISCNKKTPVMLCVENETNNSEVGKYLENLYKFIDDLSKNPITEEELKEAKSLIASQNDERYSSELAEEMSIVGLTHEEMDDSEGMKIINNATTKDMQDIAQKYFDLNKVSIVVAHPYKTPFDKVKKVNEVSFKGNVNPLDSKDIHEYVLPNNLRVVVDTRPNSNKSYVKLKLSSQKKLYSNPESANLLSYVLLSDDSVDNLEKEKISSSFACNTQDLDCEMNGKSSNIMEMIGYAAGVLINPAFQPKRFDVIKSLFLDIDDKNQEIREKVKDELLKESPYHYIKDDAGDIELTDLKSLHKQILKNAQGSIFITMPKDEFEKNKTEIFETLSKIQTLKPYSYKKIFNKVDFRPVDKAKVFIKSNENDTQLNIEQSFKNIESGNIKDRAGLMILNNLLGGDDKSLLFQSLREKDKISYAADSAYCFDSATGKVSEIRLMTTITANDNNLRTVFDEYKKSIEELINQPVNNKVLENAKVHIKNSQLSNLELTSDKNEYIANGYNSFYGASYQDALFTAIDEMTPEYIQALAKHYLTQPSIIAIEGNKKVIEQNKDYLAQLGEVVDCT